MHSKGLSLSHPVACYLPFYCGVFGVLQSFLYYFGMFRLIIVFETTALLKIAKLQYFPLAPFARSVGSLMRL